MKSKINIVSSLILFFSLTSFDNLNEVKPNNLKYVQPKVNCRIVAKNTYNDCINHGFDFFESLNIATAAYDSCMLITKQ